MSEEEQTLSGELVLVIGEVSFGYNGPRGWAEDEYLLGKSKPKSEELVYRLGEHSRKVLLIRISTTGTQDREES